MFAIRGSVTEGDPKAGSLYRLCTVYGRERYSAEEDGGAGAKKQNTSDSPNILRIMLLLKWWRLLDLNQ